MLRKGTYTIDITDIYNRWVTGETANRGLALVRNSENNGASSYLGVFGATFASFNSEDGDAPYISNNLQEKQGREK